MATTELKTSGDRTKILVIEDNPDSTVILTIILSRAGYSVVAACDGGEAIDKVRSQSPDLVLADLAMPKVSGVDVIRAIKDDPKTQHIPIVVVSGHARDDQIGGSARQLGIAGYITKPFQAEQLLREVKKNLHRQTGAPER